MLGQRVEVVELAPVQDALAVGLRAGQHPRAGAGGDQHDVGLEHARSMPSGVVTLTRCAAMPRHVVDSSPRPAISVDTHRCAAERRCRRTAAAASDLTRLLMLRQIEILASSMAMSKPRPRRAAQLGAHAGGGDERLRRHAVPQHARPADAVAVDDGDLGYVAAAGGGDQRRLIAGGAAADDHDAGCHRLNLVKRAVDRPANARSLRAFPVPLYAAYGSNMHPEQMLQRAPHSPMAGTGWLHGWRLTFGGEDIGWEGALATSSRIRCRRCSSCSTT